ncbi:MAG: GNAT family N-acetyltransferase [Firmicutes bacterium]|nr:GNAT family N-acetyltransferase [Bacillota bacterium]
MTLDIKSLSRQYKIRLIQDTDVPLVYELCRRNLLYYQHCPPFVTEESIRRDMTALPPKKTAEDKYYVGFFDRQRLICVMDLIMDFPDNSTAFIGFFMTDASIQGKGVGSAIITDLCACLSEIGILSIRLGWVKGNLQAEHFWHKNGFTETGNTYGTDGYTVVVAQRAI